jgi:hypothetical protein
MGWTNSHLYEFIVQGLRIGLPDEEFEIDSEPADSSSITLSDVMRKAPLLKSLTYWYDFGDDWFHELTIEKTLPADPKLTNPSCIGGKRACPPEDCGGVPGYEELLETLANPKHPDREELMESIGEDFDPEAFDMGFANYRLASLHAEIEEWKKSQL